MNTRRARTAALTALALSGVVGSLVLSPAAQAADGDGATSSVTATLTPGGTGSRSVTSVTPTALVGALNTSTLSGSLGVVVTEAARSGSNAWSVTATASDLSNGTQSIAASNLSVSDRSVVQVASGGTTVAPSGSQSLEAARTLFSSTGQDTNVVYTGVHTGASTVTLAVPNGSAVGAYTGTITVSLIQ